MSTTAEEQSTTRNTPQKSFKQRRSFGKLGILPTVGQTRPGETGVDRVGNV